MSNHLTSVQIAIALHGCLGEHVSLYLAPNGQKGMFMRFAGRLERSGRQVPGFTLTSCRYMIKTDHSFITFTMQDVKDITDNQSVIHLK